jgi:hypothetical protein
MNVNPIELFEGAVAEAIRSAATLSPFPRLRPSMAVDSEGRWTPEHDRAFPVIVLAGSPPRIGQGERTCELPVEITCMTNAEDDQGNKAIREIYSEVQAVVDSLFASHIANAESIARDAFDVYVSSAMAGQLYSVHVGGFQIGDGRGFAIDEGANTVSMELIVHYSRSDF